MRPMLQNILPGRDARFFQPSLASTRCWLIAVIMMTAVLEATEVRKSFGGLEILHGVNFSLGHGERVALMGPSGSGKSTLLNCLCGIEPVNSGEITVAGNALTTLDKPALDELRRGSIGYVFQAFHLLPTLTAAENIEMAAQLAGLSRALRHERVAALLEEVGMQHRANHRPSELSGGERQRIAVARAVVHRPAVILADEPTGSLDSVNGERILDLIEMLSDEFRIAVLLVTHDVETTRICRRTLTMHDGAIQAPDSE